MFEVSKESYFAAAHNLRGYGGKCEELHGHNWRVRLCVRAEQLDHLGMVVDFKILEDVLGEILSRLDHHFLNEIEPFDDQNPSAENISKYIAEEAHERLTDDRVRVHRCEVWESEGSRAIYYVPHSPSDDAHDPS